MPYVKAASNWNMLLGDAIHADVTSDGIPLKEWERWRQRIEEVAGGKWNHRTCAFDEDSAALCG
jgi:hypothetical protein